LRRFYAKPFNVAAFIAKHATAIQALSTALAENFDTPAQRLINAAFERMGEHRFVGGDDRWEQVVAHQNGWEYVKPAKHLIQRWASY